MQSLRLTWTLCRQTKRETSWLLSLVRAFVKHCGRIPTSALLEYQSVREPGLRFRANCNCRVICRSAEARSLLSSGSPFVNCPFDLTPSFLSSHIEGTTLQAHAHDAMAAINVSNAVNSAAADRELQRRISIFLANRRLPYSSKLRIDAKNGVVTLQGTHHSFYHKQLCINCCQRVAGVVRLIDATRVLPER
jgi:hypothetical protein